MHGLEPGVWGRQVCPLGVCHVLVVVWPADFVVLVLRG